MILLPVETNIYKFNNNNKNYIYDVNSGLLSESNEMLDDVLDLVSQMDYNRIIEKLGSKYGTDNVKNLMENILTLMDRGYLYTHKDNSIRNNNLSKDILSGNNTLEHMYLTLSYSCNLDCIYCYAEGGNFGREKRLMTKEIAKDCIDYWYSNLSKEESKVKVSFYGGEPLLNKKVLLFSVNYINELTRNSNIQVYYNIVTNGTLIDDEIVELFTNNKFNVLFSIDGDEKIQNKNRPFLNGKGSYDIARNNIQKLKSYNIEPLAKITLTHENVPLFKETVMHLWDIGFLYVNYVIVLTNNKRLQITMEDTDLIYQQLIDLSEVQYDYLTKNKKYKLTNLMDNLFSIDNNYSKFHSNCSFYNCKTIIFTPEREIYNCEKLIGEYEHRIGDINRGIEWDLVLEREKNNQHDMCCSTCLAKRICGEGCIAEKNQYKGYSDLICRVNVNLFKISLMLYTKLFEFDKEFVKKLLKGRK